MKFKVQFKIWALHYFAAPFSWSKWVDIKVFNFGHEMFLLQGKVNSRSNAKKFRITGTGKWGSSVCVNVMSIEELMERGLIDQEVKYNC